jgi:leader peptidase (prepilin peptidase)/N-methyltransferase
VAAAVVGGVVGSFLNVCIHRLPLGMSIVRPGSCCPSCGRRLAWFDNIPILSYVALAGRCRSCRTAISVRYPLVEAVTAAMFAAGLWHFGPGVLLASKLVFGCLLLVLFAIDLEHQVLPNVLTVPGIIAGFLFSTVAEPGWMASLAGIVLGGGSLWLLYEVWLAIRREEALGFGDVKMLAMIGAFLGWRLMLLALVLASFAGSLIGLIILAARKGTMKSALPFGTFLAAGAAIAATLGQGVIDWYLRFW